MSDAIHAAPSGPVLNLYLSLRTVGEDMRAIDVSVDGGFCSFAGSAFERRDALEAYLERAVERFPDRALRVVSCARGDWHLGLLRERLGLDLHDWPNWGMLMPLNLVDTGAFRWGGGRELLDWRGTPVERLRAMRAFAVGAGIEGDS